VTVDPWQPTSIIGVLRRNAQAIEDERGSFTELWRSSLTKQFDEQMVQQNLSRSRAGVLRGMHFHRHQVDLWTVLEGRALAATTDVRGLFIDPAGKATSQVIELGPGDSLFIPREVAHGFWALEDVALLYLVSNEYDGTDELGFAWNDSHAGIDWPPSEPILSDRDRSNPPLMELVERLRQQTSAR
jgi:dTDP-4-dehydrorhamnose 3,5-epimerase